MRISVVGVPGCLVFVAQSSFAEKDVVKAAGFRWHDPSKGPCWQKNCPACRCGVGKFWWTDSKTNAARLLEFCDEDAQRALADVTRMFNLSRAEESALEVPAPEGQTYRPYQLAGIEYILEVYRRGYKGCLQGDDMGLGKTIQALGTINADLSLRMNLVVCPKALRINWRREAEKWLVRPTRIVEIVSRMQLEQVVVEESREEHPRDGLFIVNYDRLVGASGRALLSMLSTLGWDLLIADEAQALKNPKAQRTRAVLHGLLPKARRFLPMTGTPIPNRPVEAHPVLEACSPQDFPFFPYVKRYCAAHQFVPYRGADPVWDFSGASNLEELQAKLRGTVMIRRRKAEVLKELPPKQRQIVVLPREKGKPSRTLEEDFARASASLTAGKFEEFAEFSQQRHDDALAKMPQTLEFLRDVVESDPEKKLIVWAHHHDVIDMVAESLREVLPEGVVVFDGRITDDEQRQVAVDLFQNDPSTRVFIGSITAGGTGLTLTAASHEVFIEEAWNDATVTQAEDRAWRIGQENSVLVQHLVLDGTIDALMIKVIVAKQEVADRALDRKEDLAARMRAVAEEEHRREAAKPRYPKATDAQREWARDVVLFLAARCDGARDKDGMGFNAMDTRIGKSIAARAAQRPLTDAEVAVVRKFARTYRGQLAERVTPVVSDDEVPF